MRKTFFLIFVLLAALCGMLCACGETAQEPPKEDTEVCEHEFGEWSVLSPATCEMDGTERRDCKKCEYSETRAVPKTGHQSVPKADVLPTCTEAGSVGGEECALCGKILKEPSPVPMLGHSFGEWENVEVEGIMTHRRVCLRDETHVENAPCSFLHSAVAPTCEREGFTAFHCTVCFYAENKTDIVPKTEHDFGDWIPNADGTHSKICKNDATHVMTEPCTFEEIIFPAECEKEGYRLRVCLTCAAEYKDEFTAPLGHDYSARTHISGTDTHQAVCKNNSAHVFVEACDFMSTVHPATCEERGYTVHFCEVCNHSEKTDYTEPLGHNYLYEQIAGTNTHRQVCTRDASHTLEAEACVFLFETVEPTCTQEGFSGMSCTLCHNYTERNEDTVKPALGHDFGSWISNGDGTHKRVCSRDGAEEHAACTFGAEEIVPPTCTSGGYTVKRCSTCGFEQKSAHVTASGHAFGAWKQNGDGTHSRTCSKDGYTETKSCVFSTESTLAPTCTAGGYTVKVCVDCAFKTQADAVAATGHKWQVLQKSTDNANHEEICMNAGCGQKRSVPCSMTESTVAPTCEQQGYDVNVCRVCGNSFQDNPQAALGHQWLDQYYREGETRQHYRICKHNSLHKEYEACSLTVTEVVEPTCTSGGYTAYTCAHCGYSYADNTTPMKGHSFGDWERKAVIYTYHEHTCSVCGLTEQQDCEKYVVNRVEPTCTQDGYAKAQCTVCGGSDFYERYGGNKILPALGHHFGSWKDDGNGKTHTRTCTRENCNVSETKDHTMVEGGKAATCGEAGAVNEVCSECFYAKDGVIEALGHQWKENGHDGWEPSENGKHARVCARCHLKEETECDFLETVEPATCTKPEKRTKTCETCGKVDETTGDALGHTWGEWSSNDKEHTRKCTLCNFEETKPHDFSKSNLCECSYDGLDYKLENNYYVVIGDSRIANAENVVIPARHQSYPVKEIGKNAFLNGKLKTLTLPSSLEKICEFAFNSCSLLEKVTVSGEGEASNLKRIEKYAFSYCKKLVEFVFPDSLERIEEFAFLECTSFAEIKVPEETTLGMRALYNTAFYTDPTHWEGDYRALYVGRHLVRVNPQKVGEKFEIESGTTIVCSNAFDGCSDLKELTVPETVIEFRTDSFLNCTNLENVTFSGTLESWLKIVCGNDHASPLCYGAPVFHIDHAEGEIQIPEGTATIPSGTFRNTKITKVTIPSSVTSIGAGAFYGCKELKEVVFSGEDNVIMVGKAAFFESGIDADGSKYWKDGVLYVGKHLIKAKGTVEKVTVEEGTKTISPEAFKDCASLTEISIPESLKWIGEYAFQGCTSLQKANFAENMDFLATQLKQDGSFQISRHVGSNDSSAETLAGYLKWGYLGAWKRY